MDLFHGGQMNSDRIALVVPFGLDGRSSSHCENISMIGISLDGTDLLLLVVLLLLLLLLLVILLLLLLFLLLVDLLLFLPLERVLLQLLLLLMWLVERGVGDALLQQLLDGGQGGVSNHLQIKEANKGGHCICFFVFWRYRLALWRRASKKLPSVNLASVGMRQ